MFKYLLSIFIFLIFYSNAQASNKDKIIDTMEENGIVSKANNVGKREVIE